ncbi:MAG: beta-ketoacyl synthase N-terminal-like domain-containing protein [Sphingomonadales bacterium]
MSSTKAYIIDTHTISPLGLGTSELLAALQEKKKTATLIEQFDPSGLAQPHACEVAVAQQKWLDQLPTEWQDVATYDRKFALWAIALLSQQQILKEIFANTPTNRTALFLGLGANAFPVLRIAKAVDNYSAFGLNEAIAKLNYNNGHKANSIFNHADLYGAYFQQEIAEVAFCRNLMTACSSSTQAIAFGAAHIMAGQADLVLAGGTDSIINQFAYISFGKLGVLSPDQCRPFDVGRNGTIAGECAGFTLLASEAFVHKNNLKPKAALIGFGNSMDAYKITAPDPSGAGVERALRSAIEMSGIRPEQIDYINAHGTGTRSNDEAELRAIERVVGAAAPHIFVSSTKDRHGHAIAAAGIQEFHVLTTCIQANLIAANLSFSNPLQTNLQLPFRENKTHPIRYALTNNFAFGGVNCSLVLENLNI